jgi:hypothetical protein
VTDQIPAGTFIVSATPSTGSCSGTTSLSCTIGALGNGQNASIAVVLTTAPTTAVLSSTATVSTASDWDPSNNTATAIVTVDASLIPAISPSLLIALAGMLSLLAMKKARD